jgi:energy-coupling factor transport system substrate-specific component
MSSSNTHSESSSPARTETRNPVGKNTVTPPARKRALVNPNSLSLLLTVSALAVVLNVLGGTLVGLLALPFLFLDTIGTFLVSALFGIRWGILVGVVSNLVLGVTSGPSAIPFALVQVAIAVIVGGISNRWGYTIKTALIAGGIVAIVAPLIGAAIAIAIFGGLTGGAIDVLVLWLEQAGQGVFGAAFWPRLGSNLVDKILTAFVTLAILKAIPESLVKRRYRGEAPAAATPDDGAAVADPA